MHPRVAPLCKAAEDFVSALSRRLCLGHNLPLVLFIYLGEIQMTAELIAQLAALFLILGAGPIIVVLLYVRGGNL